MRMIRVALGTLALGLLVLGASLGVARAWDCAEGTASRATSDADGHSQPTIRITGKRIYVAHFSLGSCSHVEGTRLSGPNGDYYFTSGGYKYVQPGTYRHWVVGRVTSGPAGYPCSGFQEIESLVCYH